MNSRIKILYIIDYFHITGGTEKHLSQLVRHLPKERFECTVVVFDLGQNALIDAMLDCGISVIHLPVAREYTPNAAARALQLYRIIRRKRIDIVQTFHQKADTYGALVAKTAGVKHIVSSKRDTGDLRKPWHVFMNRRLRGLFDRFIVVADAVGEVIAAKEGVDRAKITKIYNGLDENAFRGPTAEDVMQTRSRLGFRAGDFVVGMVAVFRPEKNHAVFFEGALKAVEIIPTLKLLVVGGGPLLEHFRGYCSSKGLGSRVALIGEVSDVRPYLTAMDVACLLPGKNEGFSNSIIEKMAMGLPLIVTDIGGNAEAVIDGHNGLVIPANDVAAFTAALIKMHADPTKVKEMGRKSRQLVEEKFTIGQMCRRHEMLYEALVA